MANYSALLQRATLSTSLSVGAVYQPASPLKRIKIYEVTLGSEDTPANVANLWTLQRHTTAGTWSSAITPQAADPADGAASALSGSTASADPTYTANAVLAAWALNQQATLLWAAVPGMELVIPATANNGLGLRTTTAPSAVKGTALVRFAE